MTLPLIDKSTVAPIEQEVTQEQPQAPRGLMTRTVPRFGRAQAKGTGLPHGENGTPGGKGSGVVKKIGRPPGAQNKATLVGKSLRGELLEGFSKRKLAKVFLDVIEKKGKEALKGKGSREFAELARTLVSMLPREDALLIGKAETIYVGPGAADETAYIEASTPALPDDSAEDDHILQ